MNNAPQLKDGRQRGWTSFPDALDDKDIPLRVVSLLWAMLCLLDRSLTAHGLF
jgi:hypothetical protein